MYHRALYDIVMDAGRAIGALVEEMQDEDELFRSTLTLRAVEAHLMLMAHTVGNLTPALQRHLQNLDWNGWAALHEKLRHGVQPRRDEIWYAVRALVPQTMTMLQELRRRQPVWFEVGY